MLQPSGLLMTSVIRSALSAEGAGSPSVKPVCPCCTDVHGAICVGTASTTTSSTQAACRHDASDPVFNNLTGLCAGPVQQRLHDRGGQLQQDAARRGRVAAGPDAGPHKSPSAAFSMHLLPAGSQLAARTHHGPGSVPYTSNCAVPGEESCLHVAPFPFTIVPPRVFYSMETSVRATSTGRGQLAWSYK